MATELSICTSAEAAESDEDRARITPNTSCSCTPRSSSSAPAAGPSSALFYSNPWSSPNSPRTNGGHSSANSLNPNSKAVPIITPKTRHLSGARDQGTVDEEVWQLKRALLEKDMELRRRKVHAANVQAENSGNLHRILAKDIEHIVGAMEDYNSNGQRSCIESPRKLHAKLASMKLLLEEAYNTCELKSIELYNLRRDVGLTHARELEVERNVYAAEVRRLQEVVKKLKEANGRMGHESHLVCRLKAKNHHLEVMNLRLSSCLSVSLSQTPTQRTPRTPRIQQPRRDAFVRNSFGGFDYIQQQQENAFSNRLSVSPATCLPR